VTDKALLLRVLTNLMLNALEASSAGGTVRLAMAIGASTARFSVWNDGAIPAVVVPRVFQRFFSTKGGHSRGHGTFAVKLLVERYLGGEVGFSTSAAEGTTFWVELPRE
jgi:signal transduction histidine kinase